MSNFELDFDELDQSIAEDNKVEIDRLVTELKDASQKYYSTGTSQFTDAEWNTRYDRLKQIDPTNPILDEVGHGYDVDIDLDENDTDGVKFEHPIIAGSITKTKDIQLILKKIGLKSKFSVKLDGNAIFAYYRKGVLETVATRGRNNFGIDKTHKFKTILPNNIPVDLEYVCVKGEAVIDKADYTSDNGFDVEVSSRNTVAGLITKQTDWEPKFKFIKFVTYIYVNCINKKNVEDQYDWSQWFEVEEQKDANIFVETPIDEFYDRYKANWRFDCDGTVFRFDDGSMLALKYDDEVGKAIVTQWPIFTIGIDQRLTPVQPFAPTKLSGATIRKASIGSFNKLVKLGLWPSPDKAEIEFIRANEIIPKVVSARILVPSSSNDMSLPKCPVCGTESTIEGKHVFCKNPECKNIEDSKLYKFAGFFYPKGLSDAKATNLFEHYGIKTVIDLLKFNYKKHDFTRVDGIGTADSILFMAFFDKLAGDIDSKVIYQSMIVSCGKTYSKEIVKSGFSIKNIANREEYHYLTSLKNFSSKVILELEKEAPKVLHILSLRNVIDDVPKRIVGSFCITQARFDDAQIDRLKRLGWVEDTSVKKTTTVLITSDIDNVTGKVEKARKYGIDVMEIAQFFEQYIDDAEEVE